MRMQNIGAWSRIALVFWLSSIPVYAPADLAHHGTPAPRACEEPTYPIESQIAGEEGVVILRLLIGTDGSVLEGKVQKSSGFPRLDNAALSALVKCPFKPKSMDGKPVQDWTIISYKWELK